MRTYRMTTILGRGGLKTGPGYRHGLGNDEKKNSSDNFKKHLELPVGGLEIIMQ